MIRRAVLFALASLVGPATATAADPSAGEAVFTKCKICHTLNQGGRNMVGPNLHGLFGRKAGTVEGFNYSPALRESGIVWDEETLARYLRDPRGSLPGNRMTFPGIKDDTELVDLLAFLRQATQ